MPSQRPSLQPSLEAKPDPLLVDTEALWNAPCLCTFLVVHFAAFSGDLGLKASRATIGHILAQTDAYMAAKARIVPDGTHLRCWLYSYNSITFSYVFRTITVQHPITGRLRRSARMSGQHLTSQSHVSCCYELKEIDYVSTVPAVHHS